MKPIRLVVVDDSAVFLQAACSFLAQLPGVHVVGTATSGSEGIMLSMLVAPDLVLMDLMMPGMSGLATTTLLKTRPKPPRVVIVTVQDNPEYRLAAETAMADGFLCKSDFAEQVPAMIDALFPESGSRNAARNVT